MSTTMLERVVARIRGKRIEEQTTLADQLHDEVVEPLANEQEVDADFVDDLLAALGLDDAALQNDCKQKKNRYIDAAGYKQAVEARIEAAKLDADIEKLGAERQRLWDELTAKITPLATRSRELHIVAMQESTLRSKLIDTVMRPRLKTKLADLNDQARSLSTRRSQLMDSPVSKQYSYAKSVLEGKEGTLQRLKRDGCSKDHYLVKETKQKLESAQKQFEGIEPAYQAEQKELASVNKALDDLQRRRREVEEECLVP